MGKISYLDGARQAMHFIWARLVWLVLVCALILLPATRVGTVLSHPRAPLVKQVISYPLTSEELESFWDTLLLRQMAEWQIPGAVVIVVKDDQVLFTKGYGFADQENQIPVNPETTLFHSGSVTKLFTATAIMQLWERGVIDLDADIDAYLPQMGINIGLGAPVTIADLLTHSSGLEDRFIGTATRHPDELMPLCQYVASRLPVFSAFPAERISYSNHGYTLLGCVIEEVTGESFTEYVTANILTPLDMHVTAFAPDDRLESNLAVGYDHSETGSQPFSADYYFNLTPAGSLMTSATDIAHFMIAHLDAGCYQNACILEGDTLNMMHTRQITNHPALPGWTYGFYEHLENGLRGLEHTGAWRGYGTMMYLLPDQGVGVFVAYNQFEFVPRDQIIGQFLEHFYASQSTSTAVPEDYIASANLEDIIGNYSYPRWHSQNTLEKLISLLLQVRVRSSGNGTLIVYFPGHIQETSEWVAVGPGLFRRLDGDGYLAFGKDETDNVTQMYTWCFTPVTLEKLPWYETTSVQLMWLGLSLLVFIISASSYLYRCLTVSKNALRKPPNLARLLAGLNGLLNLAFLIGLCISFLLIDEWELAYGMPLFLHIVLGLPLAGAILAVVLPIFAALAWRHHYWTLGERWRYTIGVLNAIGFILFLHEWNLLGFHY